jgi:glycosyltransferase involved in cell wall biosynthesis
MKVVYFSKPFFTDCDFPLVNELQSKGVDVRYYVPLYRGFQHSALLDFERPWKKWGIYKASKVKEMQIYNDCIDLNRMYLIGGYSWHCWNPFSWLLWALAYFHILFQKADVLHITWQLGRFENILFFLPQVKKILTVHDPMQHSGLKRFDKMERERISTIKWADKIVLLNNEQKDSFSDNYNIPLSNIFVSKLGLYDSIAKLKNLNRDIEGTYIIFFGLISPHKGIEYLLEAMIKIHEVFPDLKLVIAGGGKLYFDVTPYNNLDYIVWRNRYIGVSELAGLVRNSLFSVCPYKDATQSGVVQTSLGLETPVVVTNVGNLPDIIGDLYGEVVEACSSDALYKAICDLMKAPQKLQKMKDNIRNRWIPSMGWSDIADGYISIYK